MVLEELSFLSAQNRRGRLLGIVSLDELPLELSSFDRGSRLLGLDPFENFFPMYRDALGGRNSDSHLIPLQGKNCNGDLIANFQGFPDPAGKNEHGTTSDFFLLGQDFRPERRGKPFLCIAEPPHVRDHSTASYGLPRCASCWRARASLAAALRINLDSAHRLYLRVTGVPPGRLFICMRDPT